MEYGKKFIVIGSMNAITYKEIFPLLKDNQMWLGCNSVKEFIQPDGSIKKFGNIYWYTNLDHKKRHEELIFWKHYTPEEYPKYDNYDAINVDKVNEIPVDYKEEKIVTEEELVALKNQGFDIEILEEIEE